MDEAQNSHTKWEQHYSIKSTDRNVHDPWWTYILETAF